MSTFGIMLPTGRVILDSFLHQIIPFSGSCLKYLTTLLISAKWKSSGLYEKLCSLYKTWKILYPSDTYKNNISPRVYIYLNPVLSLIYFTSVSLDGPGGISTSLTESGCMGSMNFASFLSGSNYICLSSTTLFIVPWLFMTYILLWLISAPLNLFVVLSSAGILTLQTGLLRSFFLFLPRKSSERSLIYLHLIMSSPFHVPLYIQGSCLFPWNINYEKRETIRWSHSDLAWGCSGKPLLIVETNPDGIYFSCLKW